MSITAGAARAPACAAQASASAPRNRALVVCRAQKQDALIALKRKAAAAGAAALLLASPLSAVANEFDLLANGTPDQYVLDDASVLNKTTRKAVGDELRRLEEETGFRLEVATVRKLEYESDAFAFGDKLVKKWFPSAADNKGILIVVTAGKDGALTGGPAFVSAVGENLIDSVVGDNISILTEEEKYNEAVSSSVARIAAVLEGKEDPGPVVRNERTRQRTYKTKSETQSSKSATSTIVLSLLLISFVVPMLQYFGYTNED